MKVLFFHNTAPDYRIPFFEKVSEKLDTKFIFTAMNINKKIYGNDIDYERINKLDYKILQGGIKTLREIHNEVSSKVVDVVVIPPLDSTKEYIKGLYIFLICKYLHKNTIYFWEKWESPKRTQTLKRRFKNCLMRVVARIVFNRVDICLSPGSKNREYFIKAGVKEDNIRKIHDACEVPTCITFDIREKYNIPKESKIVLYYGRIIEQKGLDILIKAFAELPIDVKSNMYLLIVGNGDFKSKCEMLAENLGINNIKFVGYMHPKYRYIYFSQCDIFVHPGRFYEGRTDVWGLTLNEALQFGKVIISTNAVGSAYELINDNNGLMIKENNVYELTEALTKVSVNEFKIKANKESKKIFNKYNYETMSDDFVETVLSFR